MLRSVFSKHVEERSFRNLSSMLFSNPPSPCSHRWKSYSPPFLVINRCPACGFWRNLVDNVPQGFHLFLEAPEGKSRENTWDSLETLLLGRRRGRGIFFPPTISIPQTCNHRRQAKLFRANIFEHPGTCSCSHRILVTEPYPHIRWDNISRFEFPIFPLLDAGIPHFRPENQVPHAKIRMMTAGQV